MNAGCITFRKRDKGTPQRFWNYVRALGAQTKNSQPFICDEDGNMFEGDTLQYTRQVISDKFSKKAKNQAQTD